MVLLTVMFQYCKMEVKNELFLKIDNSGLYYLYLRSCPSH